LLNNDEKQKYILNRDWELVLHNKTDNPLTKALNYVKCVILTYRQLWDEDLLQWSTVEKLDEHSDVFHFVRNSMAPHPTREYCVLRYDRKSSFLHKLELFTFSSF